MFLDVLSMMVVCFLCLSHLSQCDDMTTLDDKLLGEKLQYYYSSSEDEESDHEEEENASKTIRDQEVLDVELDYSADGSSVNTGTVKWEMWTHICTSVSRSLWIKEAASTFINHTSVGLCVFLLQGRREWSMTGVNTSSWRTSNAWSSRKRWSDSSRNSAWPASRIWRKKPTDRNRRSCRIRSQAKWETLYTQSSQHTSQIVMIWWLSMIVFTNILNMYFFNFSWSLSFFFSLYFLLFCYWIFISS